MAEKIKIYFLGAGQIAVPIMKKLVRSTKVELVGIGTQPDRPAGRGGKFTPTPVGLAAAKLNVFADKIANVNDEEFLEKIAKLNPDMVVVVSFGQLLKDGLLNLPKFGCINVHASLLPKYRGASPIVSAILNLDNTTGVSFMIMERGLDTGGVFHTESMQLVHVERADHLEKMLGDIGAAAIEGVLLRIASGESVPVPQDNEHATVCRKIKKADGMISWQKTAREIDAMVRAYTPWPGAVFVLLIPGRSIPVTIVESKVHQNMHGNPGEVLVCDKKRLIIACGKGALELLVVSAPGKREMGITAFLNGFRGMPMAVMIEE